MLIVTIRASYLTNFFKYYQDQKWQRTRPISKKTMSSDYEVL
jgi:hypothetical protein